MQIIDSIQKQNLNINGCINDTNMLEHFNYHNIRKNLYLQQCDLSDFSNSLN